VETAGGEDDDADHHNDAGDDDNAWGAAHWLLLRFVEAHSHARAPVNFADEPALGRWVSWQRRAYAAELERCNSRITAAQQEAAAHRRRVNAVEPERVG
jgi:hypothetical protein